MAKAKTAARAVAHTMVRTRQSARVESRVIAGARVPYYPASEKPQHHAAPRLETRSIKHNVMGSEASSKAAKSKAAGQKNPAKTTAQAPTAAAKPAYKRLVSVDENIYLEVDDSGNATTPKRHFEVMEVNFLEDPDAEIPNTDKPVRVKTPEYIRINLEFFKKLDKQIGKKYSKKHALLHNAKLIAIYEDGLDAYNAAIKKFPEYGFLIQQFDESPVGIGALSGRSAAF